MGFEDVGGRGSTGQFYGYRIWGFCGVILPGLALKLREYFFGVISLTLLLRGTGLH